LPPVAVLRVEGLRKAFASGRSASLSCGLGGVTLHAIRGEILGIFGPSGCGKTTLLRCVAGLMRADSGSVVWFGTLFRGGGCLPELSFVPSKPDYYPFLTAPDALEYHVDADVGAPQSRRSAILDALRSVGLGTVLHMQVRELYASQVAAIAVAEALASKPKVIAIDGALDTADLRESIAIKSALAAFANSGGTVVVASRRAETFDGLATRVLRMEEGRIAAQAAPASTFGSAPIEQERSAMLSR
jgi:ABC-type multidrug transport system ATPase subunit